jgi:hypothetical protein
MEMLKEQLAERVKEQIVAEVESFLTENWDSFMEDFQAEYMKHEDEKPFKKSFAMKVMIQPEGPDSAVVDFSGNWSKSVKVKHEPVELRAFKEAAIECDASVQ